MAPLGSLCELHSIECVYFVAVDPSQSRPTERAGYQRVQGRISGSTAWYLMVVQQCQGSRQWVTWVRVSHAYAWCSLAWSVHAAVFVVIYLGCKATCMCAPLCICCHLVSQANIQLNKKQIQSVRGVGTWGMQMQTKLQICRSRSVFITSKHRNAT